jgi:hypothetical protein
MDAAKRNKISYWTFTILFTLPMIASGFYYFSGAKEITEGLGHLGYPLYIIKILGPAKILGGLTILIGKWRTLKEWAYAGFTINLIGASASHCFAGDPIVNILSPLIFLAVMFGSYFFWKKL